MKCQACQTAHAQVYCQESQAALCKGCSYVMGDITRFRLCALCECHPAKVFCHNDNAALCETCDADIHLSNPLAVRHDRVPLGPLACELTKVSAQQQYAAGGLAPLESQHFGRRVAACHVVREARAGMGRLWRCIEVEGKLRVQQIEVGRVGKHV